MKKNLKRIPKADDENETPFSYTDSPDPEPKDNPNFEDNDPYYTGPEGGDRDDAPADPTAKIVLWIASIGVLVLLAYFMWPLN